MNDFREYSAAFMDHQDALMHSGVKGMKWHHHKRKPIAMESMYGKNLDWAKFYLNDKNTKDNIQIARQHTNGWHFVPGTNGEQLLSSKEELELDKKEFREKFDQLREFDKKLGDEKRKERKKKQMYERYKSQYGKKKGS